jgi:hypothetical protein
MQVGTMDNKGNVKFKTMNQSDLTSECWVIQMWGIDECKHCVFLDTDECGGKEIRKWMLANTNIK